MLSKDTVFKILNKAKEKVGEQYHELYFDSDVVPRAASLTETAAWKGIVQICLGWVDRIVIISHVKHLWGFSALWSSEGYGHWKLLTYEAVGVRMIVFITLVSLLISSVAKESLNQRTSDLPVHIVMKNF